MKTGDRRRIKLNDFLWVIWGDMIVKRKCFFKIIFKCNFKQKENGSAILQSYLPFI